MYNGGAIWPRFFGQLCTSGWRRTIRRGEKHFYARHVTSQVSPCVIKPKFHYADFATKFATFLPAFFVHCHGLNPITATQTGLSPTCRRLCRNHLDIEMVYVCDISREEVSVKVGIGLMEFGLNLSRTLSENEYRGLYQI